MRRPGLALLPLAAALAAVGGTPSAQASCVPAVTWHGTTYLAAPTTLIVPSVASGPALRGGTVPPCDDTVIDAPDAQPAVATPPTAVTLRRARHVDPRVGVLLRGVLYVTPACNDQLAETLPTPTRLPARCGR
jgi:hypothetical protein